MINKKDIFYDWFNLNVYNMISKKLRTDANCIPSDKFQVETRYTLFHMINIKKNYLAVLDYPTQLVNNFALNERLLPDHGIIFVVGVVGVPQLTVRTEFKLQKLVSELTLMSDIVA